MKYKIEWRVESRFQISLHIHDLSLLLQLQNYFGGIGSISKSQNMVIYYVSKITDLNNVIIPHFKKYPLLSQKAADLILFTRVVELMTKNFHLTIEGIYQIINIKASMNLGLSDVLKSEFINFSPVESPLIITNNIPNPNWLSGFVTGEGNFDVNIHKSKHKIGQRVRLRFRITQHERDINLMKLLIKYLGAGKIEIDNRNPAVYLLLYKISDITNIIIPFFEQNPLYGIKLYDYLDWCKFANLMNEGSHITVEGLELNLKIKTDMNTGRKF
jgi:hypothetical protein